MKLVIVEDEPMVAKRLRRFIEQALVDQPMQLQQFYSLDDASDYLASHSIDVLFLDLNLNGQDGFTLLREQLSRSFHTIVVSANTERAINAFDIGVLDFVAKPFTQQRIAKALARLLAEHNQHPCQYLSYKRLGQLAMLPVNHIRYLQASGHYTEVHTMAGEVILHDKNLNKLLTLLPPEFQRIHRSYAVAWQHCRAIESQQGSKYLLLLDNGERLPIGRTYIKPLKTNLI